MLYLYKRDEMANRSKGRHLRKNGGFAQRIEALQPMSRRLQGDSLTLFANRKATGLKGWSPLRVKFLEVI